LTKFKELNVHFKKATTITTIMRLIRVLNTMFGSIINKCKDLITTFLNNPLPSPPKGFGKFKFAGRGRELSKDKNNYNYNKIVINISLYTFFGFIMYIFLSL
jgi:hypothetical protein